MRLLVAWFTFSLNGGIGRFVHLAGALERMGHTVGFASLIDQTETPWPQLNGKILTLQQALAQRWDAVMIPGAGAPPEWFDRMALLHDDRFGTRVQHILNDPSLYAAFSKMNDKLKPHVVIFNNSHWNLSDYGDLEADAFYVEPGAVDLEVHFPTYDRPFPLRPPEWHIGGIATKNAQPLLSALDLLPHGYRLHLFGAVPNELGPALTPWVQRQRVVLHGALFGADLAAFFRSLDLVVTTEVRAGWCNTAAEAFANRIPCIVSRPGTIDFARHHHNCLLLETVTPEAIARAVLELTGDPKRMEEMARRAFETIQAFSYDDYARRILTRVQKPAFRHYFNAPRAGLFGRHAPCFRNADLSLFKKERDQGIRQTGTNEGQRQTGTTERHGRAGTTENQRHTGTTEGRAHTDSDRSANIKR